MEGQYACKSCINILNNCHCGAKKYNTYNRSQLTLIKSNCVNFFLSWEEVITRSPLSIITTVIVPMKNCQKATMQIECITVECMPVFY